MTRNRERRAFTVAAKSSGHQGFVSIPAKAPRVPQKGVHKPIALDPWAEPVEAGTSTAGVKAQAEPRRILPNLNAWEALAPELEPEMATEPRLPRVRRVTLPDSVEDTPRRRGRPRKHPLPIEIPSAAVREPEPEPSPVPVVRPLPAAPALVQRKARPQGDSLRLGERWKRRLPRACW